MGSCVSANSVPKRRQENKARGKVVYLKYIKETQEFKLQLSRRLEQEKISNVPEMDIQKSDLYIRR